MKWGNLDPERDRYRQKAQGEVCMPGREASGRTNPTDTLKADLQPPELRGSLFCCLSHQAYGILLQLPEKMNTKTFEVF